MDQAFRLVSMTGYGRGEMEHQGLKVLTEIRSVNHRFLEVVVRLPQGWMALEDPVRKMVGQAVKRGRVDVFISIESAALLEHKMDIDWKRLERLVEAGKEVEQRLGIPSDLRWSHLIHKPEFWLLEEPEWDVDEHRETVLQAVEQAVNALMEMRRREGTALARDLEARLQQLMGIVSRIEQETPSIREHVEKRLKSRLEEMLQETDVESDRIVAEVAVWVEKADITEELTRLKSHAEQFRQTLTRNEPVGRRLDFLLQEMNREVNTIGSKANFKAISSWVVDAKSELEKMKEQVQNIE